MKITPAGEDEAGLHALYVDGMQKGSKTGWPSLDNHYTVAPHQITVVTGIPSHGKSEWLDALTVNLLSRPYQGKPWRFLVCSPENYPQRVHESKYLERIVGKPYGHVDGRMTWEEVSKARQEILSKRFDFLQFEEKQTFPDALPKIKEYAERHREWQVGVVLDPWNQLEHNRPQHMSETEYISEALTASIRVTRKTGLHLWIVAHPQKMLRDKSGERSIPTPYDISGSANWYNKSDNCITVWRDIERGGAAVKVFVQKVRFKHIGSPGEVDLRYDRITGRYHELLSVAKSNYEKGKDGE